MTLTNFRSSFTTGLKYAILIVLSVIMISPVVTAFSGSIRTNGEFLTTPFGLPVDGINGIQWQNYTGILTDPGFWNSMKNSFIITVSVTILNVSLSSLLAFAFSRVTFPGRSLLFNILSLGLLFPLVIAILPVFIQIRQIGWINTHLGIIFPLVASGIPGSVVILRGFFISIPNELEDASYIDGCTTFGFFRYILLPLARPALTAVGVLQVIAAWNEYFLPYIILNDEKLWPLPLGIWQFQGQYGADWARIMAYVMLLIIPAIIFYLFTEKYIVTGLTGGELKG